MKNKFNLYTKNHDQLVGIEDILYMLEYSLNLNNLDFKITEELDPECNNIVIDEFTKYWENRKLRKFNNSDKCLNLLVTEFINASNINFFGKSIKIYYFNNFEVKQRSIKYFYLIALCDHLLNKSFVGYIISSLLKSTILIPINLIKLLSFIFSPVRHYDFFIYRFIRYILGDKINNFKNTIFHKIFILILLEEGSQLNPTIIGKFLSKIAQYHNVIYNIKRFLGIQTHIKYFNNVFFSHPKQIENYKKIFKNVNFLSYFLPSFDIKDFYKNFLTKEFGFYFSGRLTNERITQCFLFTKNISS